MHIASIDQFDFLHQIGQGAHSKVYLARHQEADQLVAIKVYDKTKADFAAKDLLSEISQERFLLQLVEHPFLIKLFAVFQDFRNVYLVMEFCPGGDLFAASQRVQMTKIQITQIAAQLIIVLEALHQNNVILRDLRPENVAIDSDGYIRVIDPAKSKHSFKREAISSKKICGSIDYLAPEQILRQSYSQQLDIWQLGILLYEITTQTLPFYSQSVKTTQRNILKNTIKLPQHAHVSQDLVEVIMACTEKDPTKRVTLPQLKQFQLFKKIDFQSIQQKKIRLEYKPHKNFKQNFDPQLMQLKIQSDSIIVGYNKTCIPKDVDEIDLDAQCYHKLVQVTNKECLEIEEILGRDFKLAQRIQQWMLEKPADLVSMGTYQLNQSLQISDDQESRKFLKFFKIVQGDEKQTIK